MTDFPYDAVLWDIDGTLADSEPVHERSMFDTLAEFGLRPARDFKDEILGSSEEATHAFLVQSYGLSADFPEWERRRQGNYLARRDEVIPHPEAWPLWQALEARGVAQATVSNSARVIVDANLERLGLAGRFVTLARDDVAKGKPDPEPYLTGAARLDVAPERVAVVEDSATGLAAGHGAGMTVFMMPHFAGDSALPWRPVAELAGLLR